MSAKIRKTQKKSIRECMENYNPFLSLPQSYQDSLVRRIERGCYNANIEKAHKNHIPNYWDNKPFVEQYETICYRIKANLDPASSVNEACGEDGIYLASCVYHAMLLNYFVDRFKQGTKQTYLDMLPLPVLFEIFEHIDHIQPIDVGDLSSIELNPSISKKYIEEIALRENQTIKKKYTTVYPCPAHGHRMANYREVQTRSGDEGSTLFLTCLMCGDRWRVYD
jgi:DNA-directed RNA polymerase subunit M/transcription elongation factor TFIIS